MPPPLNAGAVDLGAMAAAAAAYHEAPWLEAAASALCIPAGVSRQMGAPALLAQPSSSPSCPAAPNRATLLEPLSPSWLRRSTRQLCRRRHRRRWTPACSCCRPPPAATARRPPAPPSPAPSRATAALPLPSRPPASQTSTSRRLLAASPPTPGGLRRGAIKPGTAVVVYLNAMMNSARAPACSHLPTHSPPAFMCPLCSPPPGRRSMNDVFRRGWEHATMAAAAAAKAAIPAWSPSTTTTASSTSLPTRGTAWRPSSASAFEEVLMTVTRRLRTIVVALRASGAVAGVWAVWVHSLQGAEQVLG